MMGYGVVVSFLVLGTEYFLVGFVGRGVWSCDFFSCFGRVFFGIGGAELLSFLVFGAEYFLVGLVGQSAQSCDFFVAKTATILSLLSLCLYVQVRALAHSCWRCTPTRGGAEHSSIGGALIVPTTINWQLLAFF